MRLVCWEREASRLPLPVVVAPSLGLWSVFVPLVFVLVGVDVSPSFVGYGGLLFHLALWAMVSCVGFFLSFSLAQAEGSTLVVSGWGSGWFFCVVGGVFLTDFSLFIFRCLEPDLCTSVDFCGIRLYLLPALGCSFCLCFFFVYSRSFHSLPLVAALSRIFPDLVGGVSLALVTFGLRAVVWFLPSGMFELLLYLYWPFGQV